VPEGCEAECRGLDARESTILLEQRLDAAKEDPEAYFKLQAERNARRKAGKVDGMRVETGAHDLWCKFGKGSVGLRDRI